MDRIPKPSLTNVPSMTTPSENQSLDASVSTNENARKAPDQFLHYPPPGIAPPKGLQLAGPKDHKPLYKMMKMMLKPRHKVTRVKHPKWKHKKPYY